MEETALLPVIVFASSVWVMADASHIGARRGLLRGTMIDMGPVAWFFACLGLWIICFPAYIANRSRIRAAADAARTAAREAARQAWAPQPRELHLEIHRGDGVCAACGLPLGDNQVRSTALNLSLHSECCVGEWRRRIGPHLDKPLPPVQDDQESKVVAPEADVLAPEAHILVPAAQFRDLNLHVQRLSERMKILEARSSVQRAIIGGSFMLACTTFIIYLISLICG
jgi:hypothetical protein